MAIRVEWTPVFEGEGKGGAHTPTEAPDSLFSNSTGAIVDLISEGEIEGLVDGNKSIYFNEVALLAEDGVTTNFKGVNVYANYGLEDQPALPGFDDVRTSVSVSQDLPYNTYKTISFPNDGTVTAVSITIASDAFFEVQSDGDTVGTSVTFVIEKSENGGSFVPVVNGRISGKQRDEYDVDYRVSIDDTAGNTAIRVKRTKPDATSLKVNDKISFKLYTKIVEHKLAYPNRAVIGSIYDAKQFGNQLPSRGYKVRGIKCRIPHNYNPVTRTYTGTFTGALTTSRSYTNNPAWVFYDLVTSKRYGLGQYFDDSLIDIPSLYTLGKWCDDLVPDGIGGTEPRWVCNTYLTNRDDAFNVLKELVTCFRGVLFWMDGKLWAQADLPRDPVKLVTNANVIDGLFTYSGESNRSRNSVVNVAWNDPALFYRRAIETYEDPDLIREIGWKPMDVQAVGATSRAQARRLAKAVLYGQEFESELITYRASFDHMAVEGDGPVGVAPGDVVLIADHERGNAVGGGRVCSVASNTFVGLVDPTECDWTGTGTGTVYLEHALTGFVEYVTCTYNPTTATVTLTGSPLEPLAVNDLYIILDAGFDAEPFRVIKVSEVERNILEIAAARYDEGKFAAIYDEFEFESENIMRVGNGTFIAAPTNLTLTESYVYNVDHYTRSLELRWDPVIDRYLDYYLVTYTYNNDAPRHIIANASAARIEDIRQGAYHIAVQAVNRLGVYSLPATIDYGVPLTPDPSILPMGIAKNLVLQSGGVNFVGKDAAFSWEVESPTATFLNESGGTTPATGFTDARFRDFIVTVKLVDDTVLRTESVTDTRYTYTFEKNYDDTGGDPQRQFKVEVQYRDIYGRVSDPTMLTVANPAPDLPVIIPKVQSSIFTVRYLPSPDPDFAGIIIWMSDTTGFTPGDSNRIWQDRGNPALPIHVGGVYYYRYAGYDGFGTIGLNVSDELTLDLSSGVGSGHGGFAEVFLRWPTQPPNPDETIWNGPMLFDSRHQTWTFRSTDSTGVALAGTDRLKYDDGTYVAPQAFPTVPDGWGLPYPEWTNVNFGPVWRLTTVGGDDDGGPPVPIVPSAKNYVVTVGHYEWVTGAGPIDYYGYNTETHNWGSIDDTVMPIGWTLLTISWENIHFVPAPSNKGVLITALGSHPNSGWATLTINGVTFRRADAGYLINGNGNTVWSWNTSSNPFGTTSGAKIPVSIGQ
jgi:hypothetical protein